MDNLNTQDVYIEYLKASIKPKKVQLRRLKDMFKHYVDANIDDENFSCFVQTAINSLLNIQALENQICQTQEIISFYDMDSLQK